jgi:hypothetical protein
VLLLVILCAHLCVFCLSSPFPFLFLTLPHLSVHPSLLPLLLLLSLCMLPFLVAHSEQDYHFAPCVASISLWSGKGLDTQALPVPTPKLPPPEPPSSPSSKKDQPPPLPEPEERPKQRQVEDKYSTTGGCRLILGSSEGSVRIFESSTRVSTCGGWEVSRFEGGGGAHEHT